MGGFHTRQKQPWWKRYGSSGRLLFTKGAHHITLEDPGSYAWKTKPKALHPIYPNSNIRLVLLYTLTLCPTIDYPLVDITRDTGPRMVGLHGENGESDQIQFPPRIDKASGSAGVYPYLCFTFGTDRAPCLVS